MRQSEAWDAIAHRWAEFVRKQALDAVAENWAPFAELLPDPGRLTIDLGCGEGRVARHLRDAGHSAVGIDSSPTMIRLACAADPTGDYPIGDAGRLPLGSGTADLVVAFMSLQDIDDHYAVSREVGRVLEPRGRFCIALIHPLWSAGCFEPDDPEATFRIEGSYFESFAHRRPVLKVPSIHRPLEAYARALEEAGLLIEALRELPAGRPSGGRLPAYLHIRAVKP